MLLGTRRVKAFLILKRALSTEAYPFSKGFQILNILILERYSS